MPEFIRPRRVVVDEGGSPAGAIAVLVGAAAIISAASTLIADVLYAILFALGVACAAGIVVFVVLLRRSRAAMSAPESVRSAAATRAPVAGAVRPPAIEARRVVPGVVLDSAEGETIER